MSFLTPGVIYRVDLSVDDPKPVVNMLVYLDFSVYRKCINKNFKVNIYLNF